jgi:hypothetical protein
LFLSINLPNLVSLISKFCFLFETHESMKISIAAALSRNLHLLSLDLWNNDVGERGAGAISEAISTNSTLQELDIGSNAIMDSGFLVIVNALGSSSLVKLLCRVNQIGNISALLYNFSFHDSSGLMGVQGLVAAVPKLLRLRELHLWGNDLTISGGVAVALSALSQTTALIRASYR